MSCGDTYRMCEDITKRKAWQTNDSGVGRNLGNFGGRKASSSEMGRGGRKHLLFPGTGYGNRDLILASSRRWLRMRREMKGEGQQSSYGVRNYLFALQAIDSSPLNYHVVVWSETTVEVTYAR